MQGTWKAIAHNGEFDVLILTGMDGNTFVELIWTRIRKGWDARSRLTDQLDVLRNVCRNWYDVVDNCIEYLCDTISGKVSIFVTPRSRWTIR